MEPEQGRDGASQAVAGEVSEECSETMRGEGIRWRGWEGRRRGRSAGKRQHEKERGRGLEDEQPTPGRAMHQIGASDLRLIGLAEVQIVLCLLASPHGGEGGKVVG